MASSERQMVGRQLDRRRSILRWRLHHQRRQEPKPPRRIGRVLLGSSRLEPLFRRRIFCPGKCAEENWLQNKLDNLSLY